MEKQSQVVDQSKVIINVEENLDEETEGGQRMKMRDIDLVFQCGEMKSCSRFIEAKLHKLQHKEEVTSQIPYATASIHSDEPLKLTTSDCSVEPTNGTCLGFGLDSIKSIEQTKPDAKPGLDNANPFHPYKILGQVRSSDAAECDSTTGPLEESKPLRMWKEMKQNGFLSSSSHGGIPIPKRRGRQPKRKKEQEVKKKTDTTKRERPNKYTMTVAPIGLLSGLNPGIMKHVRNSKQVNSIIEAMLQAENSSSQVDNRPTDRFGTQFSQHLNRHFLSSSEHGGQMGGSDMTGMIYHESTTAPQYNEEYQNESGMLKLSSAVTKAAENASRVSNDDSSARHDAIASLSLKGASVASQWLDLLQQDIKGRLATLRQSKKRVCGVIQTELPYLLSKVISSDGGSSKNATSDMHMARWKSIFSQMDKALDEEGKYLENWLIQVQELQSQCEGGLKYFSTNRTLLHAEESSGPKKSEATEKENVVRAAAASIYSTCNFILPKENVPCL